MTAEHKVIGGISLVTILILVGGVFFLSKGNNSSVPADQIVASNGLHWHPKLTVYIKKGENRN